MIHGTTMRNDLKLTTYIGLNIFVKKKKKREDVLRFPLPILLHRLEFLIVYFPECFLLNIFYK